MHVYMCGLKNLETTLTKVPCALQGFGTMEFVYTTLVLVFSGGFHPKPGYEFLELLAEFAQVKALDCWGTAPSNMAFPSSRPIHSGPPMGFVDLHGLGTISRVPFLIEIIQNICQTFHNYMQ